MEIADLFKILADYLNFVIDFATLRGMEAYGRTGVINPKLVSFFASGLLLAYLLASLNKVPSYEKDALSSAESAGIENQDRDKVNPVSSSGTAHQMATHTVFIVIGGVLFHGIFVLYNKALGGQEVGLLKDTLNAVFAVWAVQSPMDALFAHIKKLGNLPGRMPRSMSIAIGLVLIATGAMQMAMAYYWVFAMAEVHCVKRLYVLGAIVPLLLVGLFIGITVSRARKAERRRSCAHNVVAPTTLEGEGDAHGQKAPA